MAAKTASKGTRTADTMRPLPSPQPIRRTRARAGAGNGQGQRAGGAQRRTGARPAGGNPFTRTLGGVPLWVWLVAGTLLIAGVSWWRNRQASGTDTGAGDGTGAYGGVSYPSGVSGVAYSPAPGGRGVPSVTGQGTATFPATVSVTPASGPTTVASSPGSTDSGVPAGVSTGPIAGVSAGTGAGTPAAQTRTIKAPRAETLAQLAKADNWTPATYKAVQQLNGLKPTSKLRAGQAIKRPA